MPVETAVVVNTKGMDKYLDLAVRALDGGNLRGPLGVAAKHAAQVYRSDMQERFQRYSLGGGDWPQLAHSTIFRRRHRTGTTKGGKAKFGRGKEAYFKARIHGFGQISILRDTGMLFRSLDPVYSGQAAQYQAGVTGGIAVGFGGSRRYANTGKRIKGVGAAIADVAAFHHFGLGRNPQRTLLDQPSSAASAQIAAVWLKGCQAASKESDIVRK